MYEVWFLGDIELDCDSVKAASLEEAIALGKKMYGELLVEVRSIADE